MDSILFNNIPDDEKHQIRNFVEEFVGEIDSKGYVIKIWGKLKEIAQPWIGKSLKEILGEEKAIPYYNGLEELKKGKTYYEFEYESMAAKDEWRLVRMLADTDNFDRIILSFKNISYIKNVQKELFKKNYLLNSIIEHSSDEIHIVDKELNLVLINKKLSDIIANIIGETYSIGDSIYPLLDYFEVKKEFLELFKNAFNGERINFIRTFDSVLPDKINNKQYTKEYFFEPIYLSGKIEFVCVVTRDLTLTQEAILAAKAKNSQLLAIMDSANMGIIFFNEKLQLILTNETFKKQYFDLHNSNLPDNITLSDFINRFSYFDDTQKEQITDRANKALKGKPQIYESEYYTNDGKKFFQFRFAPVQENQDIIGLNLLVKDITRAKTADERLKKSEERLKLALQATGEGIWDWNIKKDETYHSPGWLKIMEIDLDKYVYDQNEFSKRIHPDDFHIAWNNIYKALNKEVDIYESEFRMITDNGNIIWVSDRGKVVQKDEDGNPMRMVGAVRDITDNIKARETIKANNAYLESIINSNDASIWLIDLDDKILFVNDSFQKEFGHFFQDFGHKALIGTEFHFDSEIYEKIYLPYILKAKKGRKVRFEFPLQYNTSSLFYETIIHPIYIEENTLLGLCFFCTNITERKLHEKEIINQKQFIEQVINLVPNLIFVKDDKGRFILANKAIAKIYATPIDNLLGKTDAEINGIQAEVDNFNIMDKKVLDEQITIIIPEEPVSNPLTGERKWFQTVKVPMISTMGQKQVLGVSTDITDRKIRDEERAKLIEELILKNKNMEQFTYIVSHNLRSPVAKILGLTDILNLNEDNQATLEFIINSLKKEANQLDTIITDLNAIINLKNNIEEVKQEVNISDVFNRIKNLLEKEISQSNAKIIENLSKVPTVYGIKTYLHSVLYNLTNNSIKYRNLDEPLVIEISTCIRGEFTEIKFSDNGLGMDLEKNKENIFGLFKRFHHHIEGKGMGLHITKTQVEMMGGKIDLESEVGEGTTFYIYLPNIIS